MSMNFPNFPHIMGFVASSLIVENLGENPYIFHMMTLVIFFCVYLCITLLLKYIECQRKNLQSLFFP